MPWLVCGVACFVVLGGFVVGFFLLGKFDLNHMLIPVVDRPCLALVRQCRKKKARNDERVARRSQKFAFHLSFGRPMSTKRREGGLPS